MNNFEILDIPKEARLGWYVVSIDNGVRYLHGDGRTHVGTEDSYSLSTGYFDSEYEAYKCSQRYYKYHSVVYPHAIPDSQNVNDGSQQMNFGR